MNTQNFENYNQFINFVKSSPGFCERKKLKTTDKNYICYHSHHIIPKAFGGTNEKSNLILLTCKEHIIAHILLCKEYDGLNRLKMLYALQRLLTGIKSPKDIDLEKIDIEEAASLLEERNKHAGDFCKGPFTEEHKLHMRKPKSESHKANMKKPKSEEHKKHISEAMKTKGNFAKMAKNGENYFKGKHHSNETKETISKKFWERENNMSKEDKLKRAEHLKNIAGKATLGLKCFRELSTGKLVKRKTHPGEGFVTTAEWAEMHRN